MEMCKVYLLIFALVCEGIVAQRQSPCPELFEYEPQSNEENRWYGVISLRTTDDFFGVWLRVVLDRPAELLGNWFGSSTSSDNIEFSIRNPSYNLKAGTTVPIRFFIQYSPTSPVPNLAGIRMNGRVLCPIQKQQTESPPISQLHISEIRPASNTVFNGRPSGGNSGSSQSYDNNVNSREPSANRVPVSSNANVESNTGDFLLARPTDNSQTARPSSTTVKNIACGTTSIRPTPLVSYGQNTSEGQWPWHVALYHSQGIQLTYTCGGSLVSEYFVVTAAHCVAKPSTTQAINPQNLVVYLGKSNLKKFGAEIQDMEVSKIIIHRDYNYSVFHNDIALLKLGRRCEFTDHVRPVCLWSGNTDLNSVLDRLGTVVGWGFDESGHLTNSLQQAQMPVVSSIKCVYSNPDFFSRFTFDKSYCAGFRNGTTVCNGDSGGGMVFPKRGANSEDRVWHLRGIVSVGVALQGKTSCDPSHYIVFTDVAKHLDWIRNVISNN